MVLGKMKETVES
ncbi:hypothetical protein LINPERPRIM_LOCUS23777 [Linum perenne]